MIKNWRLLACLFALPALSLFSEEVEMKETTLETQETVQMSNKKAPAKMNGNQASQLPEEQMIQSSSVITPSVAPHVIDGVDAYFTVDFIWWKSVLGGSEYAYTGVVDGIAGGSVPVGASTGEGRVQKQGFTFQPGFKVGLGANFDHDGWDLYAQYTNLISQKETNDLEPSAGVGARTIPQIMTNNAFADNVTLPLLDSDCKWKQSFSVIDLELGRDYFISRSLTLRPSAGLKTAWITEQSKINYAPVTTYSDAQQNSLTNSLLTYRQNMWGIGIRTALNAGWHFTKNWAMYNDFAFTALWSDFHIHQKQNLTGTTFGQQTTVHTHESLQTVIPVLEAGLGFSYITWWDCSRYRFEFRAGWEEQIWLDFNHYMTLGGTGNLSLHGLTLKAMVNF